MTTTAAPEIRFLSGDDASEYWRLRLEALEGDPEIQRVDRGAPDSQPGGGAQAAWIRGR